MPKLTILSCDWWKSVKSAANPKYIKEMPEASFQVTVEVDKKLVEKTKKDALLLDELTDAGNERLKLFIQGATAKVAETDRKLDAACQKFLRDFDEKAFNTVWDREVAQFETSMRNMASAVEKQCEEAVQKEFKAFQKMKAEYRGYKIRTFSKIGLKIGSISMAIVKLAGTQGTDVLAWRSLIKNSIKTVTEVTKYCRSADKFRKDCETQLKLVLAWEAKLGDGKGVTAADAGLALLKVAIGTDCEMTLDAVSSNVKQYQEKLKGVKLNAHKASQQLNDALDKMEEAQAKLPKGQVAELDDLEELVTSLIERIGQMNEQASRGMKWAATVLELVKGLQAAKNLSHAGRMVKALDTAYDIGSSVHSWVGFAEKGEDLGKKIASQAIKVGKNIERWDKDVRKMLA